MIMLPTVTKTMTMTTTKMMMLMMMMIMMIMMMMMTTIIMMKMVLLRRGVNNGNVWYFIHWSWEFNTYAPAPSWYESGDIRTKHVVSTMRGYYFHQTTWYPFFIPSQAQHGSSPMSAQIRCHRCLFEAIPHMHQSYFETNFICKLLIDCVIFIQKTKTWQFDA